jgi:ABC-type dipeptide/oligopeptide/nickel transport system ATPase component
MERSRLEKLRGDLMAKKRAREEMLAKKESLLDERLEQLRRLTMMRDERFGIRQRVAERITKQLAPTIRVSIDQCAGRDPYRELIEEALKTARVKPGRVAERIASTLAPAELSEAVKSRNTRALVDQAELTPDQAGKVIETIADWPKQYELDTVELPDMPRIELRDGDAYKHLAVLSTGQRCTAILPILLLDSAKPLLVDQPEDNLDNSFVYQTIVESIQQTKGRRQMMFVTHNPNIPVLGDADRIFVLESDGSSARKVNEGTVDGCRNEIVMLLEGGEEAFKSRKRRYCY